MLRSLQLVNFRNSYQQDLVFSSKINAIYGQNAAGKTSLLEAIYALTTAKSFRTNHSDAMIFYGEPEFTLFSKLLDTHGVEIAVGLQRHREQGLKIHMQGEAIRSIAEVTQLLPVLYIGADSHRILMDGPKIRRQFLDFGLFHVEPSFHSGWRAYQKILTQRNMALKAKVSRKELEVWNQQLALVGEQLDAQRKHYLSEFLPYFKHVLSTFFETLEISAGYQPGWNEDQSLLACFNANVSRETLVGHTLYGPHRADLVLTVNDMAAEEALSQGQQKLLSYALRLAQGMQLQEMVAKSPIFLIDDLPSELDIENQLRVMKILNTLSSQVFITGIHAQDLAYLLGSDAENVMFHVKQGVFERSDAVCS